MEVTLSSLLSVEMDIMMPTNMLINISNIISREWDELQTTQLIMHVKPMVLITRMSS